MASSLANSSAPPRFIDVLPSQLARDCFVIWRAARAKNQPPLLHDFAPVVLPAAALPWLLLHRLRPDGTHVYGLAGEELVRWFGENPKGQPALADVEAEERERRLDLIRKSMVSGLPFWFEGSLLFENRAHVPIGRLCLPARDKTDRVLVVIYFVLQDAPVPRLRILGARDAAAGRIVWCSERDLADEPSGR